MRVDESTTISGVGRFLLSVELLDLSCFFFSSDDAVEQGLHLPLEAKMSSISEEGMVVQR
jgi:hypothetical protein